MILYAFEVFYEGGEADCDTPQEGVVKIKQLQDQGRTITEVRVYGSRMKLDEFMRFYDRPTKG